MAAEVSLGPGLRAGTPQRLFETGIATSFFERYAVSRDGKRFLVPMPVEQRASRSATVVWNWLQMATR